MLFTQSPSHWACSSGAAPAFSTHRTQHRARWPSWVAQRRKSRSVGHADDVKGRAPGASGAGPGSDYDAAAAAVQQCMEYFQTGDLDAVTNYLPDEVLDRAIQRKHAKL